MLMPISVMCGATDANAVFVDGCTPVEASVKYSSWNNTDISVSGPEGVDVGFHLGAFTSYYYCPPSAQGPRKVKVFKTTFCVTKTTRTNSLSLTGWRWNPYYFTLDTDNDTVVNPPSQYFDWYDMDKPNGFQRCDSHTIDPANRKWMTVENRPAWTFSVEADITDFPNQDFSFKAGSDHIREIDPPNDMTETPPWAP
jgi:hypothetical protein